MDHVRPSNLVNALNVRAGDLRKDRFSPVPKSGVYSPEHEPNVARNVAPGRLNLIYTRAKRVSLQCAFVYLAEFDASYRARTPLCFVYIDEVGDRQSEGIPALDRTPPSHVQHAIHSRADGAPVFHSASFTHLLALKLATNAHALCNSAVIATNPAGNLAASEVLFLDQAPPFTAVGVRDLLPRLPRLANDNVGFCGFTQFSLRPLSAEWVKHVFTISSTPGPPVQRPQSLTLDLCQEVAA